MLSSFAPSLEFSRAYPDKNLLLKALLDTDLSESSREVLPSNVDGLHKCTLSNVLTRGSMLVLQISDIKDVAQSMYSQLNKENTRQMVLDDATQQAGFIDGKRLLKLQLTDGHAIVSAMEMKPIPGLSTNTLIGTKILLKSVPVQRGMLLLNAGNVEVLGGRVEKFQHCDYQYRLRDQLNIPHPTRPAAQQNLNNQLPGIANLGDIVADLGDFEWDDDDEFT
jgi:hypothetical protein